jgi:hypothetical protein
MALREVLGGTLAVCCDNMHLAKQRWRHYDDIWDLHSTNPFVHSMACGLHEG